MKDFHLYRYNSKNISYLTNFKSTEIMSRIKLENLKKNYFKTYFERNKNDKCLIWKEIKQLTTLKYENNRQLNIVTVKYKNVTNHRNVSNNSFLNNTGPTLSKTILISKQKF